MSDPVHLPPLETLKAAIAMPVAIAFSSAGSVIGTMPAAERLVLPGPTLVMVFGVDLPVLSVLFGVIGVALGQWLAPTPAAPLDLRRRLALVASLMLLAIGIVIASGQQPLVAIGWGIGLGFSGLSVASTLGSQAVAAVKTISDAAIAAVAARIGGKTDKKESDK